MHRKKAKRAGVKWGWGPRGKLGTLMASDQPTQSAKRIRKYICIFKRIWKSPVIAVTCLALFHRGGNLNWGSRDIDCMVLRKASY